MHAGANITRCQGETRCPIMELGYTAPIYCNELNHNKGCKFRKAGINPTKTKKS